MRRPHHSLLVIVTAALAATLVAQASAHPAVFFPGQVFCPPRTLTVGTVVMQPPQCFSIFLMRTPQTAFLGFVPAGLIGAPARQVISVSTSLGTRIRTRALLLLPVIVPVLFVPANAIVVQPFQIELMGGGLGVRFADDPTMVVPLPTDAPPRGTPAFSSAAFEIPLPADLHIIPPGPDVPTDEAALSGRWVGKWKGQGQGMTEDGLPHILAVEQIIRDDGFLRSQRRIVGTFAWGRAPGWEVFPGWMRAEGVMERGILQLTLPGGGRARYRMTVDGTLDGTYESPDFGVMRASLSRMK